MERAEGWCGYSNRLAPPVTLDEDGRLSCGCGRRVRVVSSTGRISAHKQQRAPAVPAPPSAAPEAAVRWLTEHSVDGRLTVSVRAAGRALAVSHETARQWALRQGLQVMREGATWS